jgi:hypothetical protein
VVDILGHIIIADWFEQESEITRQGKLIVHDETMRKIVLRSRKSSIAQFYRLIKEDFQVNTKHIYVGLERGCYNDSDENNGDKKRIYVLDVENDWEWRGDKSKNASDALRQASKPRNCVFVCIVSPNERHKKGIYKDIDGFIDAWNWVLADSSDLTKPENWSDRYLSHLFSK